MQIFGQKHHAYEIEFDVFDQFTSHLGCFSKASVYSSLAFMDYEKAGPRVMNFFNKSFSK